MLSICAASSDGMRSRSSTGVLFWIRGCWIAGAALEGFQVRDEIRLLLRRPLRAVVVAGVGVPRQSGVEEEAALEPVRFEPHGLRVELPAAGVKNPHPLGGRLEEFV